MKHMKKVAVAIVVFFSGILFKVLPVFSTTYYGAIMEKSVINEVSSNKENSKTLYDILLITLFYEGRYALPYKGGIPGRTGICGGICVKAERAGLWRNAGDRS